MPLGCLYRLIPSPFSLLLQKDCKNSFSCSIFQILRSTFFTFFSSCPFLFLPFLPIFSFSHKGCKCNLPFSCFQICSLTFLSFLFIFLPLLFLGYSIQKCSSPKGLQVYPASLFFPIPPKEKSLVDRNRISRSIK